MGFPKKSDFTERASPLVLFEKAELARLKIGERLFCIGSRTTHLREAWVLAKVGRLLEGTSCRLAETDPPDGFVEIEGKVVPAEVTVLLDPDRRWGDEYKLGEGARQKIRHVSEAEIERAIHKNVEWLDERIGAKIAKDDRYPANTVLLLYHNTHLWNFDPERTTDELEAASRLRGRNIIGSIIFFDGALYGQNTIAKLRSSCVQECTKRDARNADEY
jgi:hypothetical protein